MVTFAIKSSNPVSVRVWMVSVGQILNDDDCNSNIWNNTAAWTAPSEGLFCLFTAPSQPLLQLHHARILCAKPRASDSASQLVYLSVVATSQALTTPARTRPLVRLLLLHARQSQKLFTARRLPRGKELSEILADN